MEIMNFNAHDKMARNSQNRERSRHNQSRNNRQQNNQFNDIELKELGHNKMKLLFKTFSHSNQHQQIRNSPIDDDIPQEKVSINNPQIKSSQPIHIESLSFPPKKVTKTAIPKETPVKQEFDFNRFNEAINNLQSTFERIDNDYFNEKYNDIHYPIDREIEALSLNYWKTGSLVLSNEYSIADNTNE